MRGAPARIFTAEGLFFLLSLVPLAVFLRMASSGGYASDAEWRPAFLSGAALCAVFAAASALRRAPVRDFFAASALMLVTGAAAFIAGLDPVVALYGRLKGSIFLFWYAALRIAVALRPGLFRGWLKDPYGAIPGAAAAVSAALLAWSFFREDILTSTALPFLLATIGLSAAAGLAEKRGREGA